MTTTTAPATGHIFLSCRLGRHDCRGFAPSRGATACGCTPARHVCACSCHSGPLGVWARFPGLALALWTVRAAAANRRPQ